MKKELSDALIRDFPILYGRKTAKSWFNQAEVPTTFSIYNFEFNSGWEPIVRELSAKLEKYNESAEDPIQVNQAKEKFGTLLFYAHPCTPELQQLIMEYEGRSATTCEDCGDSGKTGGKGWIRTLCEPCRFKHDNRPLNCLNTPEN